MEKFRAILSRLRKQLQPAFPVSLQIVERSGEWVGHFGDCSITTDARGRKRFRIRIVDDTSAGWHGEQLMVDGLVHEWAHARAWNHQHDRPNNCAYHGPEWGVAFAECYRVAYGDQ